MVCIACLEEGQARIVAFRCGHSLCYQCMESLAIAGFQNAVEANERVARITCPTCRAQITEERESMFGQVRLMILYMVSLSLFRQTTVRRIGGLLEEDEGLPEPQRDLAQGAARENLRVMWLRLWRRAATAMEEQAFPIHAHSQTANLPLLMMDPLTQQCK